MLVNWKRRNLWWLIGVRKHWAREISSIDFLAGNYWIVEQILRDGLHHTDAECMSYTMGLVDGLEQVAMLNLKVRQVRSLTRHRRRRLSRMMILW